MRIYLNFLTLIAAFSFDADCAPNENVTIEDRIVNGEVVQPGDDVLRYQVSIRLDEDDKRCYGHGHICGGVMIKEQMVLTSASCLYNLRESEISVWMGNTDIFKMPQDDSDIFTSAVWKILIHPQYNCHSHENNIAILKLMKRNKNFDDKALRMNEEALPELKTDCLISGWGRTTKDGVKERILRKAKVNIMERKMCRSNPPKGIFCSRFLKLGEKTFGSDFCYEDVGGPVVCDYSLYGLMLASFCGGETSDVWYTDIEYYMKWIREEVIALGTDGVSSNLKNSFQLTCSALIILNFLNVI